MTLSLSKFHIDNTLNFAGCVISDKGVFPDRDHVFALSNFPVPSDQTGVRSFLGFCNQLAFFSGLPASHGCSQTINRERALFHLASGTPSRI